MPADPRLGLAQKYALAGLHDDAWQTLREVLTEGEATVEVFRLAGSLNITLADYAAAILFCRKALAMDAASHETQFNLALALEKTGQLEPAREVYRRALSLNPDHAVTWNNLGGVLDQLGEHADAFTAFQRAVDLAPDYAA
ncbi:MAG: tetratricopeptide repeat protein, partial [Rhodospirillaceae bacterium]|nr:tetratricopeptide repeat protein [Rhodospirillaceae bacterium]